MRVVRGGGGGLPERNDLGGMDFIQENIQRIGFVCHPSLAPTYGNLLATQPLVMVARRRRNVNQVFPSLPKSVHHFPRTFSSDNPRTQLQGIEYAEGRLRV